MKLFKLLKILSRFNKTLFDISVEDQEKYLQKLGTPKMILIVHINSINAKTCLFRFGRLGL